MLMEHFSVMLKGIISKVNIIKSQAGTLDEMQRDKCAASKVASDGDDGVSGASF